AGGVLSRGLIPVEGLPYRVYVRAAGGKRGVHVGELALHELKLADRLAELPAIVHVWDHRIEARGHDSEGSAGKHRPLVVAAGHHDLDAFALLAEHGLGRE